MNTGRWESIVINDEDADLIDRYVHVQYAPIKWESSQTEIREMNDRAKGTGA